jgi:hypothetical protein
MSQFSSLRFTVRHPSGRVEQVGVDSDRALVGSGAHCEIRLPPEHCPVEQLFVESRSGGIFAEARSMNPPALVNGLPFTQGRLLPESVVHVGPLELQVEGGEATHQPSASKRKKSSTSPVAYVAAAIGFPLGTYLLMTVGPKDGSLSRAPDPPPLWTADAKPTCPQSSPEVALAFANEELARADTKQERSPFAAKDGVASVAHYERAAACFDVARASSDAGSARAQAEHMRASMSQQFHIHRVRLERSLATKDYEAARTEVRILLTFLERRSGDYTNWLAALDRHIGLKFSGKKKR